MGFAETNAWEGSFGYSSSAGYSNGYCNTWYGNGARCVHPSSYALPSGKSSTDYGRCPSNADAAKAVARMNLAADCAADSECIGYYYGGTHQSGIYGALCKESQGSYLRFTVTVSSSYKIDVKCFHGDTSSRWVAMCGRWDPPAPPSPPRLCEQVLTDCRAAQINSKGHNGCTAYAQGWPQGDFSCLSCGSTSQFHSCCSLEQCQAFCREIYSSCFACISECYSGCTYMSNHGGTCTSPPSPPPPQLKTFGEWLTSMTTAPTFYYYDKLANTAQKKPPYREAMERLGYFDTAVGCPTEWDDKYFGFEDVGNDADNNWFIFHMSDAVTLSSISIRTSAHPVYPSPLNTSIVTWVKCS